MLLAKCMLVGTAAGTHDEDNSLPQHHVIQPLATLQHSKQAVRSSTRAAKEERMLDLTGAGVLQPASRWPHMQHLSHCLPYLVRLGSGRAAGVEGKAGWLGQEVAS